MQRERGIGDRQPCSETVGAVGDDVVPGKKVARVAGVEPDGGGGDDDVGVDPRDAVRRARGLRPADVGGAVEDLPLEVRQRDGVVVDHRQPPDPGGGEIHQARRPEPARADDGDAGGEQLRLSRAADFLQDDVAGVAVELVVSHDPVEPKPPVPRDGIGGDRVDHHPAPADDGRDDELRDPHAARDRHRRVAEVGEQHHQLAAIVAVDRPRRVGDRQPVLERQPRARPDLKLVAVGDRHLQAGRHGHARRPAQEPDRGRPRRRRPSPPRRRWHSRAGRAPRRGA